MSDDTLKLQIDSYAEDAAFESALRGDSPGAMSATLDGRVTELFQRLRGSVYRYLVAVIQDPAVAEEVTQEAFLRLYCHLRERKPVDHVRPWIFRVAHNLALNEKTRGKFLGGGESATRELPRVPADSGSMDPEQTLLLRERTDLALQQLSRHQRECLVLKVEGFRYREIAEILGLSLPNVSQSLRRGIKKLMRELA